MLMDTQENDDRSLAGQIARALAGQIVSGALKPGERRIAPSAISIPILAMSTQG